MRRAACSFRSMTPRLKLWSPTLQRAGHRKRRDPDFCRVSLILRMSAARKKSCKRALPALWITLSSDVCPEIREYERISTTCANAYVQPVMAGYLNRLEARLHAMGIVCPAFLMTSRAARYARLQWALPSPCGSSNPVPPAALSSRAPSRKAAGRTRNSSFDMGGTTAKICFIDDYEPEISRSFDSAACTAL